MMSHKERQFLKVYRVLNSEGKLLSVGQTVEMIKRHKLHKYLDHDGDGFYTASIYTRIDSNSKHDINEVLDKILLVAYSAEDRIKLLKSLLPAFYLFFALLFLSHFVNRYISYQEVEYKYSKLQSRVSELYNDMSDIYSRADADIRILESGSESNVVATKFRKPYYIALARELNDQLERTRELSENLPHLSSDFSYNLNVASRALDDYIVGNKRNVELGPIKTMRRVLNEGYRIFSIQNEFKIISVGEFRSYYELFFE